MEKNKKRKSLIVDSGATKTEWCLCYGSESKTIITEGLNPYYHTGKSIKKVIAEVLIPEMENTTVDDIFFYGAGCDGPERKRTVEVALADSFTASNIKVEHDLLAAARACFFDKPGIACILGTGSNSCLYDGQQITEHIPSLAFILGDEGSAGYFGKKLINRYFRDELPPELKHRLEDSYNMSLSYIMRELYDGTQKSRFIASYGKFLGDHKDHPFIDDMLRKGFHNFIARIIKKYPGSASQEIAFVGSVAQVHQHLIREILTGEGLKCGAFIRKPLQRLVQYHTAK